MADDNITEFPGAFEIQYDIKVNNVDDFLTIDDSAYTVEIPMNLVPEVIKAMGRKYMEYENG